MMLDIEALRVIWWVLLGVLLMGFAVMDGFDLGAATLLPLVAKNDLERRVVLNTIGPVWEGNQVWIILGAGAIFAAWPYVYAVAFSGAYLVVLLLLLTMGISRPVSFKYRSKLPNMAWRRTWDWIVFTGGFLPAIILGVLVGNVIQGLPYFFDEMLRISYSGTIIELLNPFALWCGVTSLAMLVMHGGLYLAIKTENPIRDRAIFWSRISAIWLIFLFAGGGIWVAKWLVGFQVMGEINPYGYSNPLHKQVVPMVGAWIKNYSLYPWSIYVPLFGFLGALGAMLTARWGTSRFAFVCSSLSVIGIIGTVGVSMFPFILPSSTNLSSSLLVWDASSTQLTLLLMLAAVMIFLPIVLLYTSWVYRVLRGKVTLKVVEKDEHHVTY
ncbi:MAG: cytochrome d ubiquinol oxidase subunit II [Gammaproteobacteria bacterium]|nr:cytochrome d ubiquinol oxidase subunit II [Gammaproteobacteria bacterium]MCW5583764.1 cytochrome d ubiquinol oxidase subunit II [Gammaproteobacteria bacterium]